jgi:CheY-like chemotaxis protein
MVYGFVKQSGGHIMIYSEVGEGTTVKLYLPRSLQPEDVMPPAATGPVNGGTETILVVEDDEDVRETAVAILSDLGYRVLKAKDADSALTVIDSGIEIDLLFTDVVMPGNLRSPELARKALQRLPGLGVLFTSGYTENSIVHGGRLDAGVELLTKPYTREALARRVRHILSNQAQRRLSRAVADARTLSSASSSGSAPEMQQPWQILLVEDDELIRSATRTVLEERGHRVVDAASGAEALNLLGARHFDVAVIDLGLPDMPGLALARRARERDPQLALVFATGSQLGPAEVTEGSEIVKKPYDVEAIVAACRTVLLPARR